MKRLEVGGLWAGGKGANVANNPVNWIDPWGLSPRTLRDLPGDIVYSFSQAAHDMAYIANHGPTEAKGLIYFAGATQVAPVAYVAGKSAATSITIMRIAPYSPAITDFVSGIFPGPPSGWGYLSAETVFFYELARDRIERCGN